MRKLDINMLKFEFLIFIRKFYPPILSIFLSTLFVGFLVRYFSIINIEIFFSFLPIVTATYYDILILRMWDLDANEYAFLNIYCFNMRRYLFGKNLIIFLCVSLHLIFCWSFFYFIKAINFSNYLDAFWLLLYIPIVVSLGNILSSLDVSKYLLVNSALNIFYYLFKYALIFILLFTMLSNLSIWVIYLFFIISWIISFLVSSNMRRKLILEVKN